MMMLLHNIMCAHVKSCTTCTNLENTTTVNENNRYDTNTHSKDDNGNQSNHQMKIFEALDVAIHNPSLWLYVLESI